MSRLPIPDQPRVSLLSEKEWRRRWRARHDSVMEVAFDVASSPDMRGSVRDIVEEYAWGSVTWEVNGRSTDTRPGRYILAEPGVPVEVAHARARDLVAPRLTHIHGSRLPAPTPPHFLTGPTGTSVASLAALSQVTWGPAVEGTLVGVATVATLAALAHRWLRRKRQTRVVRMDSFTFDPYVFLHIGARATADPALDALLTETLREIIADAATAPTYVTAERLAKIRAALPPERTPEHILAARERTNAAALAAAEEAAARQEYVDARVEAVAELVARNA